MKSDAVLVSLEQGQRYFRSWQFSWGNEWNPLSVSKQLLLCISRRWKIQIWGHFVILLALRSTGNTQRNFTVAFLHPIKGGIVYNIHFVIYWLLNAKEWSILNLPRKAEKVLIRGLLIFHAGYFFTEAFFLSLPVYFQVISSTDLHYLPSEKTYFLTLILFPTFFRQQAFSFKLHKTALIDESKSCF